MQIIVQDYASFQAAVATFIGAGARVGISQTSQQVGAYGDSDELVTFLGTVATPLPVSATIQTDFPSAVDLPGYAAFNK